MPKCGFILIALSTRIAEIRMPRWRVSRCTIRLHG